MLSVEVARARLLQAAEQLYNASERAGGRCEMVATLHAAGRLLAAPIIAPIAVPNLANSAMDGYAVRVADVQEQVALPVSQRIAAGQIGTPLKAGTVARIFTGAPIPEGADAVLMQELAIPCANESNTNNNHSLADSLTHFLGHVKFTRRPTVGEAIRQIGEDIQAGSVILPAGVRLTPQACGLIASVGIAQVPVYAPLRVAMLFTGDELVMPGEPLPAGSIYNSNRFVWLSTLQQLGCTVTDLGILQDDLALTRAALRDAAATHDLILTSGGVSVGEEDHVKAAVQAEGELDVWKIAVKPGKPLAFGFLTAQERRVPVIGLPGNPVSSFVTLLMFARPFLLRLQGQHQVLPQSYLARANFSWSKPDTRREYLRVKRNANGELELFPNQKSGLLTSCVWADGLVDNPPSQTISPGDWVHYFSLAELLTA